MSSVANPVANMASVIGLKKKVEKSRENKKLI